VHSEMETTSFANIIPINYVCDKIEHAGQIHGLPRMPPGHLDLEKSSMAHKVISECFERAKWEAWEHLKQRIESEGFVVLKRILEGAPALALKRLEVAGSETNSEEDIEQLWSPASPMAMIDLLGWD